MLLIYGGITLLTIALIVVLINGRNKLVAQIRSMYKHIDSLKTQLIYSDSALAIERENSEAIRGMLFDEQCVNRKLRQRITVLERPTFGFDDED
jgi:Sec-independent protein translocase protein TatA